MKNRGFTLIELLLVMSIMGIVTAFAISLSSNLKQTRNLDKGYGDYVAMLKQAKSYAQSQVKTCPGSLLLYRVVLNKGGGDDFRCFLFREICNSATNPNTLLKTTCLPDNLIFEESSAIQIDFPVQGGTVTSNVITIKDTSSDESKDVTITNEGGIITQ